MSKITRWGILGTGAMAQAFAQCLAEVPGAELAAVSSRSQDSLDSFAEKHSASRYHLGYANLVEDPRVDVVYIATPHAMHRDNCISCLEAGKSVLCEKPFAINASQAAEMIDLARDRKLFLMEAMWTRFVPAVVELRKLLEANTIGNIQMLIAGGGYIPEPDPNYYLLRADLGGGGLLDAGVYLVSMASMIFGKPAQVKSLGQLGESGVDEQCSMLIEGAAGELANLYISLRANAAPDMTLMGSRGRIHVEAPIYSPSRITIEVQGQDATTLEIPFRSNGYQFQAIEVGNCLTSGLTESDVMPLDETLSIMTTMDEVRRQIGLRFPME